MLAINIFNYFDILLNRLFSRQFMVDFCTIFEFYKIKIKGVGSRFHRQVHFQTTKRQDQSQNKDRRCRPTASIFFQQLKKTPKKPP